MTLYGNGAKPLTEVSAGHTVYLEELGVKPGDFVSYYAKATDTDTVKGPKVTSSDIYFIEVRPFNQDFRQAQSQAGGGGGGGGGGGQQNQAGALSEQQRQIIVGHVQRRTRSRRRLRPDKFKEDTVFVAPVAEPKLREQVDELSARCRSGSAAAVREPAEDRRAAAARRSAEMKAAEAAVGSARRRRTRWRRNSAR